MLTVSHSDCCLTLCIAANLLQLNPLERLLQKVLLHAVQATAPSTYGLTIFHGPQTMPLASGALLCSCPGALGLSA